MPRMIAIFQPGPTDPPRMMFRGLVSQKKKAWEAVEAESRKSPLEILDDVSKRKAEANYSRMSNLLTKSGRAWLLDPSTGKPAFLLMEAVTNEMRDWDLDGDGQPRYNPAPRPKGGDDPEE